MGQCRQEYDERLHQPASVCSNRLYRTDAGCGVEQDPAAPAQNVHHDGNGNILSLPNLPELIWGYADRLTKTKLPSNSDWAFYDYDVGGQRIRKVVTEGAEKSVRIYLGGFEIFRQYDNSDVSFERQTLHVVDDQNRIALVEAAKGQNDYSDTRVRFQLGNHLGSSVLEVDGGPGASVISYEEYYPHGGTAYLSGENQIEVNRKLYRYSGRERDDETGLYYYGARYYAPWVGRWASCDPLLPISGSNLFRFLNNNPLIMFDPDGKGELPHFKREQRAKREYNLPPVDLVNKVEGEWVFYDYSGTVKYKPHYKNNTTVTHIEDKYTITVAMYSEKGKVSAKGPKVIAHKGKVTMGSNYNTGASGFEVKRTITERKITTIHVNARGEEVWREGGDWKPFNSSSSAKVEFEAFSSAYGSKLSKTGVTLDNHIRVGNTSIGYTECGGDICANIGVSVGPNIGLTIDEEVKVGLGVIGFEKSLSLTDKGEKKWEEVKESILDRFQVAEIPEGTIQQFPEGL